MDKEIISQYLYDEYTKEYSGVKEWGKPPYKEWLEQKLFEAQSKSQESDSLPCVSGLCINEETKQAAIEYAAIDDDNVRKGSYDIREKRAFEAGVLYLIKKLNNR